MLADIIHLIAAREHASEDDKPYYPRPSIAGPERCLRQTVYWAQGEKKKPLPGRAIAVFNDGVWHEELTADWLRKSSYLVHSEQMPVSIAGILHWMPQGSWHCAVCDHDIPYRDIHGHIDFMIQDTPGVDRLVEHKGYAHFTAEALWGGQIPHDNLTQKAIYLRGTQQDQPDCKEGILLIKNKNTSGFLEFRSLYEAKIDTLTVIERVNHLGEREDIGLVVPDITENAFARFAEIERHRIEGTLPERQYDIDSTSTRGVAGIAPSLPFVGLAGPRSISSSRRTSPLMKRSLPPLGTRDKKPPKKARRRRSAKILKSRSKHSSRNRASDLAGQMNTP